MDYSYLYSIVDLYLKNETDKKKANLNITKTNDKVILRFNMSIGNNDTAMYDLPLENANQYIENILKRFKNDLLIIDEKYELNSSKKTCYYYVKFKNGRVLSFNNFSIIEINDIRNKLYNIELYKEEIRVNVGNEVANVPKNYKPRLMETGFASYKNLLFLVIIFTVVLIISLWICKLLLG